MNPYFLELLTENKNNIICDGQNRNIQRDGHVSIVALPHNLQSRMKEKSSKSLYCHFPSDYITSFYG